MVRVLSPARGGSARAVLAAVRSCRSRPPAAPPPATLAGEAARRGHRRPGLQARQLGRPGRGRQDRRDGLRPQPGRDARPGVGDQALLLRRGARRPRRRTTRTRRPSTSAGWSLNGTLRGDLILVAAGDLTLGGRTEGRQDGVQGQGPHLREQRADATPNSPTPTRSPGSNALAKQVKAAGITQIDGEVLIDDRLFARTRGSGSGPDAVSPITGERQRRRRRRRRPGRRRATRRR